MFSIIWKIWFRKSALFTTTTKKTDRSDNTWRHHCPTSPAPEVIRGRWTSPETPLQPLQPLQPLPTPSGPCTRVHPEPHSSCWAPDESHVRPLSAPEHTGRASRATSQLGDRRRDHTFVRTLDLSRKGTTFCRDKEASLGIFDAKFGGWTYSFDSFVVSSSLLHAPALTFPKS